MDILKNNYVNDEVIKPNPRPIRLFFFWSGIIATLAYRVIIVLNYYSPLWVKISWYIGTIGFIVYFWHRYDIQKKRAELVDQYKLIEAVDEVPGIDIKRQAALRYLVTTTKTTRARWNSMFIFLLSILALIIGIVLDVL
jgi:hypothetical protein